jgi:hypothetical protein
MPAKFSYRPFLVLAGSPLTLGITADVNGIKAAMSTSWPSIIIPQLELQYQSKQDFKLSMMVRRRKIEIWPI